MMICGCGGNYGDDRDCYMCQQCIPVNFWELKAGDYIYHEGYYVLVVSFVDEEDERDHDDDTCRVTVLWNGKAKNIFALGTSIVRRVRFNRQTDQETD